MPNGEKLIEANGVDLCVETFGDAADPAILLIHGASASMLWWEEELCERIAAAGRHVIRFDNRDTGRSVSYPPGQPEYTLRELMIAVVNTYREPGMERYWVPSTTKSSASPSASAKANGSTVTFPQRFTRACCLSLRTSRGDGSRNGSSLVRPRRTFGNPRRIARWRRPSAWRSRSLAASSECTEWRAGTPSSIQTW